MYESKRWKFIVEEDHYTLLVYEVRVEDSGVYECIVLNKLGKATCTAKLNVQGQFTEPLLPCSHAVVCVCNPATRTILVLFSNI